jgi:hypothetical protein
MSIRNNFLLGKNRSLTPEVLAQGGPIIPVEVGITSLLADLYVKEKRELPAPQSGFALIDTGASRTCVDDDVIRKLKINPIGEAKTTTAAGVRQNRLYPAHLNFPTAKMHIEFSSVIGVDLKMQKFNNQAIIALLGRDVLSSMLFVYNGPAGMFTLAR